MLGHFPCGFVNRPKAPMQHEHRQENPTYASYVNDEHCGGYRTGDHDSQIMRCCDQITEPKEEYDNHETHDLSVSPSPKITKKRDTYLHF
jgi:hypothetical protein